MAANNEVRIRVGAEISPAEKAINKLLGGVQKLQTLADGALRGLKTARLTLDTRAAERQLRGISSALDGLDRVRTVRVRVVREFEDRQLGGATSNRGGGGNGMSMALLGAAAGAGITSRQPRRALQSAAVDPAIAALLLQTQKEINLLEKAAVLTREEQALLAERMRDRGVLLREAARSGGGGGLPPTLPPGGRLPGGGGGSGRDPSDAFKKQQGAAAGLAAGLGRLAATYLTVTAAASAFRQVSDAALNRDTALRAIRANTEQFGEYGQALTAVQSQVKTLGISQTEAAQGFLSAYNALRPLGIQLETINQVQTAFIASSRLSGASAENAAAGWRQLVQAISRGNLNGDELVSVLENAPTVAQAIAKELGVSVGKLKELGEEGSITSDKIVAALLKLRDPALSKLDVVLQGPQQQLKNLTNELQDLAVELGRVFGPAIGTQLKGVTTAVQGLVGWVKTLTPEFGRAAVETTKAVVQLFLVAKAIQAIQAAAGVVAFLRNLAATQVTVATTAGGATVATNALAASLARLASFGAITLMIKVAIDGLAELVRLNGEVDKLQGKNKAGAAAAFTGASEETVTRAQQVQRGLLVGYRSKLKDFERQRDQLQVGNPGAALLMEKNAKVLRERIKFAEQVLALDASDYKSQAELARLKEAQRQKELRALQQGVPTPDPSGSGSGSSGAAKDDLAAVKKLRWGAQIIAAAQANGIDPRLLAGLVKQESGFDATITSPAGAIGLTQLMPGTARELGVNPWDPMQNLMGGARYLKQQMSRFGLENGLRAYNQGPGNQLRYPGGVSQEAVQYPSRVLAAARGFGFGGQDLVDAQADALNAAIELEQKRQEQLATSKQLLAISQADLAITQQRNPLEQVMLEGKKVELEIQQRYKGLKDAALSAEELLNLELSERAELEKASLGTTRAYVEALYEALGVAELLSKEVEKFGPRAFAGGGGGANGFDPKMPNLNPGSGDGNRERLQSEYEKVKQQLKELTDPVNQVVAGANAIGSAFGEAFRGIASGAMTAQEALAQMFQSIANHFIDMAAQMIAKYIEMQIIGLVGSFLSSAATGAAAKGGYTLPKSTQGGAWLYGPGAPSFMAEGGFVTGPTNAVIGEGGEPEYVLPASKMGSALEKYRMGARGNAVLSGGSEGSADSLTYSPTITATTIGGKQWVTVEQMNETVRQGMAVAAKQGAANGHAKSISTLRNSRSTRTRLGLP